MIGYVSMDRTRLRGCSSNHRNESPKETLACSLNSIFIRWRRSRWMLLLKRKLQTNIMLNLRWHPNLTFYISWQLTVPTTPKSWHHQKIHSVYHSWRTHQWGPFRSTTGTQELAGEKVRCFLRFSKIPVETGRKERERVARSRGLGRRIYY